MTHGSHARRLAMPVVTLAALAIATIALVRPHTADATRAVAAANPTPMAVVDIAKVVDQLNERAALERDLKIFISTREASLEQIQNEMEEVSADAEILPEGSAERIEAARRLRELQATGQARQQFLNQEITIERGKIFLNILDKVEAAVGEIAQRDGWEIVVINDDGISDIRKQRVRAEDDALNLVFGRRILHASPRVDITNDVIIFMNNRFANAGGN
ncbi:MAG: OmpH family outer membrane protein [Planctomycetota bacterium]